MLPVTPSGQPGSPAGPGRMGAAGTPSPARAVRAQRRIVGLHGAHVSAGLLWLTFMVAQTAVRGPRDFVRRRLLCFSLFWHALDIIWVALFSVVYLMGAGR